MARFFTVGNFRSHNRKDQRHAVPRLTLSVNGEIVETHDWSLGGFRIDDYPGRPSIGETVSVTHFAYMDGSASNVHCVAEVTRVIPSRRQVAFSFKDLDEGAFNFLERMSKERLRVLSAQS
jgi:PilZ domain-containing protein